MSGHSLEGGSVWPELECEQSGCVSVATGHKPKVAQVVGIHNRLATAEKAVLSVAQAWI